MLETKIYKNYKELCNAIGWDIKGGKSKQLQLKDLERYCVYEKNGIKFDVKEIFDIPKTKEINQRNNKYGDNLERLIIHNLSKRPLEKNGKTIIVPRNTFYLQLHMINENYNYCRNNINRFSQYIKVPINCIYDFYNNTSGKLKDNVERTLNKLQRQCLIKWEYRYAVKLKSGTARLANEYEINVVLEAERKALKELEIEDKRTVFIKGYWNLFVDYVQEELKDTSISYLFRVFNINTTKDFRDMLLNESDIDNINNEVNNVLMKSCEDTARKKHLKTKEKYCYISLKGEIKYREPNFDNERARLRDEYVKDTIKIIKSVLSINESKIDLSEVSNNAYTIGDAYLDDLERYCNENTDNEISKNDDGCLYFTSDDLDELFGT